MQLLYKSPTHSLLGQTAWWSSSISAWSLSFFQA